MDWEKEKKRITEYLANLTDEEFDKMLIDCGFETTQQISEMKKNYYPKGLNNSISNNKYDMNTPYRFSREMNMDEDYVFTKGVA